MNSITTFSIPSSLLWIPYLKGKKTALLQAEKDLGTGHYLSPGFWGRRGGLGGGGRRILGGIIRFLG